MKRPRACNSDDDHASEYVVVEGFRPTMWPSKSKRQRRAGFFPLTFTVLFVQSSSNRKSTSNGLKRYKTEYEFWVNCDDFSRPENGIPALNGFVDLMNVPFPLRDVHLFWKFGCEIPVANWDCMVVRMFRFLRDVRDLVGTQKDENEKYPFIELRISKFVKLPKDEMEAAARVTRERGKGEWYVRPQTEMEWRMAVLLAKGIERVKFKRGDGDGDEEEEECCGICLLDMSVGSEVARLPCSHFTHERCILDWLRITNSCPFCRFKIAAIEGKTRPTPDRYWV